MSPRFGSRIIGIHAVCGADVDYTWTPTSGMRVCLGCGASSRTGDPVILDGEGLCESEIESCDALGRIER